MIPQPIIGAWAHVPNDDPNLLRWRGLRMVWRVPYMRYARDGDIAYCPTEAAAAIAVRTGVRWAFALAGRDEPNVAVEGPSGKRLEPEVWAAGFHASAAVLRRASIPVVMAGLEGKGSKVCQTQHFDEGYRLPKLRTRGWNATNTRPSTILRTLAGPHDWVFSPAPRTRHWSVLPAHIIENTVGMSVERWVQVAQLPGCKGVLFWCLQEVPNQPYMGLYDRRGNVTSIGRRLRAAMGA